MKKILAFTLAETLIVMGIIGIVSALTLPNLNSSTGEKEKVARIKKIYKDLTDAYGRAVAVYGPVDEWFTTSDNTDALRSKRIGERISEFMKVSKTCGMAVNQGCFSKAKLYYSDGEQWEDVNNGPDTDNNIYKIITADGTSIAYQASSVRHDIYVDTDGPTKGGNKIGLDRFTFTIDIDWDYKDLQLRPLEHPNTVKRTGAYTYYDEYIWAIENDNMDYLKCADKLNWQTKTSCK